MGKNLPAIFYTASGSLFALSMSGYGPNKVPALNAAGTAWEWRDASNASLMTSGTLPDARLSANVPIMSGGLINLANIPAAAISTYLGDVSSQSAMLALAGQPGDWCTRADTTPTETFWILIGSDPTQLANWKELQAPGTVTAVNGLIGSVNLTTSNISEGTNLYHTDARSRAAISASSPLSYNSASGALSIALATIATTGAIADSTGTLALTRGGTGLTAAALGDLLYGSAANTLSRLSGNTTATKMFLYQTGNGTVSAAPAWAAIASGDLPTDISYKSVAETISGAKTFTSKLLAKSDGSSATPSAEVQNTAGNTMLKVYSYAGSEPAIEIAGGLCFYAGSGVWNFTGRAVQFNSGISFPDSISLYPNFNGGSGSFFLDSRTTGDTTANKGPIVIGARSSSFPSGTTADTNKVIDLALPVYFRKTAEFDGLSSTSVLRKQFYITPGWSVSTDASRTSTVTLGVSDYNADRPFMTATASGSDVSTAFTGLVNFNNGLYTAASITVGAIAGAGANQLVFYARGNLNNSNGVVILHDTPQTATSGTQNYFALKPTYNQTSGTSANTDFLINRTETAIGSGLQRLIDAQVGGSTKFNVDRTGVIFLANVSSAPATPTGGVVIYAQGGVLKAMGTSGTPTTLAA